MVDATQPLVKQVHHDGFGLNDRHIIMADARDPNAGGASHFYEVQTIDEPRYVMAVIQFQHGPRDDPDSAEGITDQALLAILLDRYEAFQAGPYACAGNEVVLTKLNEVLAAMHARNSDRATRGVLGKNAS